MKVAVVGGGGIRTPLVIYGLAQSQSFLNLSELTLFDVDEPRMQVIARLGHEILRRLNSKFDIRVCTQLEDAIVNADFILNTIRVGGMQARARDERIVIEYGLAGQETTGPGGAAMALRTLPVTLAHARVIERVAPKAWLINLTNPAGLITQALNQHTKLKVIGICDTPSELFHNIARALGEPQSEMDFDYAGLNHLGWIRRVRLRGEDITEKLLDNSELLRQIYTADLFDPALIQTLRLIPTEYLFFYYSQRRAYQNQSRAGTTRGAELAALNSQLFAAMHSQDDTQALQTYTAYLNRRNASYMKLESESVSSSAVLPMDDDPFEAATGYHRIALQVIRALISDAQQEIVVNIPNGNAISDLGPEDIVELPCDVSKNGADAKSAGRLPESIRGLVISVKAYERSLIEAAVSKSFSLARLALLEYPIIGQWELGGDVLRALCRADHEHLGYLR